MNDTTGRWRRTNYLYAKHWRGHLYMPPRCYPHWRGHCYMPLQYHPYWRGHLYMPLQYHPHWSGHLYMPRQYQAYWRGTSTCHYNIIRTGGGTSTYPYDITHIGEALLHAPTIFNANHRKHFMRSSYVICIHQHLLLTVGWVKSVAL